MITTSALAQAVMLAPVLAAQTKPAITWTPDTQLQTMSSKVAFGLILLWLGYVIIQQVVPSKRAARVPWSKLIWVGLVAIPLMDLTLIPTTINSILNAVWWIGDLVGWT